MLAQGGGGVRLDWALASPLAFVVSSALMVCGAMARRKQTSRYSPGGGGGNDPSGISLQSPVGCT